MKTNYSNRNSRIVSHINSNTVYGKETFTQGRDEGTLKAAIGTSTNNATNLVLNRNGVTIELSGNEARTIFSLLEKHYYG